MIIDGWRVTPTVAAIASGADVLVLLGLVMLGVVRRRRRPATPPIERPDEALSPGLRRLLILVAVAAALGVAGIGGYRSFSAVSERFGSWTVPATADGMIVACTALRLAALTRGWRLPGCLATTYVFLVGTIVLNVDAAHGWANQLSHALAPIAYLILAELLAHMVRLHLKLSTSREARVTLATVVASPVVSWRAYLHMLRTGAEPKDAREMIQRSIRARSRLRTICPAKSWHPWDEARQAQRAVLTAIRDGLISPTHVSRMLGSADTLTPRELLFRVDQAVLEDTPDAVALADQLAELRATGELAESNHATELATLREQHAEQIEQARAEVAAGLDDQLTALRTRLEETERAAQDAEQRATEATTGARIAQGTTAGQVQAAEARVSELRQRLSSEAARHETEHRELVELRKRDQESAGLRIQFDQLRARAAEAESAALEARAELERLRTTVPAPRRTASTPSAAALPRGVAVRVDSGDSGENKRDQFAGALRERVRAGDRRLIDDNERVRNATAYETADELGLHHGTARRYLGDLLPELRTIAAARASAETLSPALS